MRKALIYGLLITFTTVASACGGNELEVVPSTESAVVENPYGGLEVPPPAADEPILNLVKGGKVISLSLNDLREYPVIKLTVFEPFVKQDIEFVGVAMEELFRSAGIVPTDNVLTVALNEYSYSNLASQFVGTEAFLAYEQGGNLIPMSRGGPIRIIVPNDKLLTESLEVWNWSLAEIRVG
jgi:hypothetical protein